MRIEPAVSMYYHIFVCYYRLPRNIHHLLLNVSGAKDEGKERMYKSMYGISLGTAVKKLHYQEKWWEVW